MVGLNYLPGGSNSLAKAVSGDGSVIVGESDSASDRQAFRWTAKGGIVGLGYLPSGTNGFAFGYSANSTNSSKGAVSSVGSQSAPSYAAPPPSSANAVSGDGSVVVGGSKSTSGYQAFRWTADGGMVGLGKLPSSTTSEATAVSGDGSVVVGVSDMGMIEPYSSCETFRWTATGGMVGLGHLPGRKISYPCVISSDGSIVMGWHGLATTPYYEAFIWDSVHGMRKLQSVLTKEHHLDLTGWELEWACGISADRKTIVGIGVHNGRGDAWLARLDRPVTETGGKKERK
jgi:probable HAF family extracellular repeat protein